MTKQIVVKLNEEKFRPLLDKLNEKGSGIMSSYSSLAGFCIYVTHQLVYGKVPALDNRNILSIVAEAEKTTEDKTILMAVSAYREFLRTGKAVPIFK